MNTKELDFTMDTEDTKEVKAEIDNNAFLCRCCLSTDRRMKQIEDFCFLLLDLTGIIVSFQLTSFILKTRLD